MPQYEAHRWLASKVGLLVGAVLTIVTLIATFLGVVDFALSRVMQQVLG